MFLNFVFVKDSDFRSHLITFQIDFGFRWFYNSKTITIIWQVIDRYVVIRYLNQKIHQRNEFRATLSDQLDQELQDPNSDVSLKLDFAQQYVDKSKE